MNRTRKRHLEIKYISRHAKTPKVNLCSVRDGRAECVKETYGQTVYAGKLLRADVEETLYYSQNETTCGEEFQIACGAVTLANAFIILGYNVICPEIILRRLRRENLIDESGVTLGSLRTIGYIMSRRALCDVTINDMDALSPGDILLLNGVMLKNLYSKLHDMCIFDDTEGNHYVVVETVRAHGVTFINPDTRPRHGSCNFDPGVACECYTDGTWGRMDFDRRYSNRIVCRSSVLRFIS